MTADFKQGANLTGQILAVGQVATAADFGLPAVPTATAWKIATAVIHNASASALTTVAVSVTKSGGTETRIALISNLAAGDSTELGELKGAFLAAGDVISINPSAATAANYLITGAVSS